MLMGSDDFQESRFVKVLRGAANHRKFRQLARRLDISRFEALGLTAALWDLVDTTNPFGTLELAPQDIADSIGIEHIDGTDLVNAWLAVGLLDNTGDGYEVHGWMEDGRSGAAAWVRHAKSVNANHVRWHKDRRDAGCPLCQDESQ